VIRTRENFELIRRFKFSDANGRESREAEIFNTRGNGSSDFREIIEA